MHDPFNARPVSGEIMADAAAMTGRPSRTGRGSREDVVEAEFETVHPDVVPFRFGVTPVNAPKGVMLLRSGGRRDRLQSRHGSLTFWAAGMALVAMVFLASGGYAVVGAGTPVPVGSEPSGGFNTASIPAVVSQADGHGSGEDSRFLGTSADQAETRGSFVFSDQLEPPKDGEESVSMTYGEEE